MRGTGVFFITPKENFKHLRSKDPQSAKVWMQGENYDVKILRNGGRLPDFGWLKLFSLICRRQKRLLFLRLLMMAFEMKGGIYE